jgi:hypothetical protein
MAIECRVNSHPNAISLYERSAQMLWHFHASPDGLCKGCDNEIIGSSFMLGKRLKLLGAHKGLVFVNEFPDADVAESDNASFSIDHVVSGLKIAAKWPVCNRPWL